MTPSPTHQPSWSALSGHFWLLCTLLCASRLGAAPAQNTIQGKVGAEDFTFVPGWYPAPNESQMKSFVRAKVGRQLPGGLYSLEGALMQNFKPNGERELAIQTPQCTLDDKNKTGSSPRELKADAADGKFLIEGTGFLWQQTNSTLFISNNVHTVLSAELLARQTNSTARLGGGQPIHVNSERFQYSGETGLGVYDGQVRVLGTNLLFNADVVRVNVPMKERRLSNIEGEHKVFLEYEGVQAAGDRAVYAADSGLARITGNPTWRTEAREGKGDELIIDQTNNVFRAQGHAWLKMLGRSLSPPSSAGAGLTNSARGDEFVEVISDNYELRTNSAVFRERVRITESISNSVRSALSCGLVNAVFSRTNELENLTAENDVIIEQQNRRLRAGRAVYSGATKKLDLTENPRWETEGRRGEGDHIQLDTVANRMHVRGNAHMLLPVKTTTVSTNAAATRARSAATSTNLATTEPNTATITNIAEIFADQYVINTNSARFDRHVRFSHPQMNWTCDEMAIESLPGDKSATRLTASGTVIFHLLEDDRATAHGTCDKAVYTYSVSDNKTNEIVELTGDPVLVTTNGIFENPTLIYDRTQNKVTAPGRYRIHGYTQATNIVQLPRIPKR